MAEGLGERSQKFREVQERADRFQGIFENSTLGIFQSSLEGRFLVVNKAFANIFGYTDPDDLHKSIQDIENQFYLHPEHRYEILAATKSKEGICKFEDELRRKDGSLIICSINIRAVRNDSGTVTHFDGFIEDVTEARLREKGLRERSENLTKRKPPTEIPSQRPVSLQGAYREERGYAGGIRKHSPGLGV